MDSKPGYKTTEFWLNILAVILSALLGSDLLPSGHLVTKILGIVATVLISLGYTVSRTSIKRSDSDTGAKLRSAIPFVLVVGSSLLTLAALTSGCCSTARCYLSRGLTAIEAADKLALPAIEKVCVEKVQACGQVTPDKCPAFQSCAKVLDVYKASMDAAGRGLGAVNRSLADLGVR